MQPLINTRKCIPTSKLASQHFEDRPKHILPYTQHKFRECLCQYCINVDLGLKALNTYGSLKGQTNLNITDKYCASNLTLCPKEDNKNKKTCLDRNCPQCGVHTDDPQAPDNVEEETSLSFISPPDLNQLELQPPTQKTTPSATSLSPDSPGTSGVHVQPKAAGKYGDYVLGKFKAESRRENTKYFAGLVSNWKKHIILYHILKLNILYHYDEIWYCSSSTTFYMF